MDAQLASRPALAFGLPSLRHEKHSETTLDLGVFLFANEAFELLNRLSNLKPTLRTRKSASITLQ